MAQSPTTFDQMQTPQPHSTDSDADKSKTATGDYCVNGGSEVDVKMSRKRVGPCTIIHLQSEKQVTINRSWHHIRNDATDVVMLWFVKRGGLRIFHSGKTSNAGAGDFAITKSMAPYSIECRVDSQSAHEMLQVLIPTHIFRKFIPNEVSTGFSVTASGRVFSLAVQLLTEVFTSTGDFTEKTERLLLESALSALSDTIQEQKGLTQQKESVSEKRYKTALHYIDLHLSDPTLSNARVAKACGISPRYLSFLLNKQGISFADHVKEKRLKAASRWLSSSRPNEITIAEIAFRVGFKSPAHFSRIFKQAFDKGPREYRSEFLAVNSFTTPEYTPAPNMLAS